MRMFKILGSRRQPAQKKPTQEKRLKEEASNEHAGSTALLDDPSFQGKKDRVVNCRFSREVSVVHYRRRTPRLPGARRKKGSVLVAQELTWTYVMAK